MPAFSLHSRALDGAATDCGDNIYSCSLLLIYLPRNDERLSWLGWLTYSGRFTHISGHPSAVGRAQNSESLPVRDQRSTAEPRNQLADDDLQLLYSDDISAATAKRNSD